MKEKPKIRPNLPFPEPDGIRRSLVPRLLRIDGLVAACLDLKRTELELMPKHELRDDSRYRGAWVVPSSDGEGTPGNGSCYR